MTDTSFGPDDAPSAADDDRRDLLRQIKSLKAEIAARDHFIGVAAHELRNPLHALALQIAAAEMMADMRGDRKIADRLKKANSNVQWLLVRSEILLDVTRTATGSRSLRLGPVDLREAIRRVIDLYLPQATASNAALHVECNGTLTGTWDPLALDQILGNLVSNAIKFGGGSPVVVSADDPDTGLVTVRVSDLGIGIAPEDQQRVFQRFDQVLATTDASKGGFGLGLWLTRNLVDAHGGSIAICSSPGAGATFTITLPKAPTIRPRLDEGGTGLVDRRNPPDRRAGP
jgi:signal transduction histidine kinase